MKVCFKCHKSKPLIEYYKHKQMADGHLNKCKECAKTDSTSYRCNNLDKIRAYDRGRGSRKSADDIRGYRERYPRKYKAHTMVGNAIRDGKLFVESCCDCGSEDRVHAHHDDYAKPLNIRWLCAVHHSQWHRDNGEALNG